MSLNFLCKLSFWGELQSLWASGSSGGGGSDIRLSPVLAIPQRLTSDGYTNLPNKPIKYPQTDNTKKPV